MTKAERRRRVLAMTRQRYDSQMRLLYGPVFRDWDLLDRHLQARWKRETEAYIEREEINMTEDLTLHTLRRANMARVPLFKNARGERAHSMDEHDWSLGEWMTAMTGEVGEAANLIKKIRRGDFSLEYARPELAKELADVLIYLDLLAHRAGIDLADAVRQKFNEVSRKQHIEVLL